MSVSIVPCPEEILEIMERGL